MNYNEEHEDVDIRLDHKNGEIKVISKRLVVEEYTDNEDVIEILLEDAVKILKLLKAVDIKGL